MAITLRTLDTTASLADQQTAIRQAEELGFRLVSLSTARVAGGRANVVTLLQQPGAPALPITLELVDGSLSQAAQEAALNKAGRQLVCYGSLHVNVGAQNVAAWRIHV
jgi:hypothetical protein